MFHARRNAFQAKEGRNMIEAMAVLGYLVSHYPGYDDKITLTAKRGARGQSPYVHCEGVPPEAGALVMIVSSLSKHKAKKYNWLLYNLPVATQTLPLGESQLVRREDEGRNSWGKVGFHRLPLARNNHVKLAVYAVDHKFTVHHSLSGHSLERRLAGHVLASAKISL